MAAMFFLLLTWNCTCNVKGGVAHAYFAQGQPWNFRFQIFFHWDSLNIWYFLKNKLLIVPCTTYVQFNGWVWFENCNDLLKIIKFLVILLWVSVWTFILKKYFSFGFLGVCEYFDEQELAKFGKDRRRYWFFMNWWKRT